MRALNTVVAQYPTSAMQDAINLRRLCHIHAFIHEMLNLSSSLPVKIAHSRFNHAFRKANYAAAKTVFTSG